MRRSPANLTSVVTSSQLLAGRLGILDVMSRTGGHHAAVCYMLYAVCLSRGLTYVTTCPRRACRRSNLDLCLTRVRTPSTRFSAHRCPAADKSGRSTPGGRLVAAPYRLLPIAGATLSPVPGFRGLPPRTGTSGMKRGIPHIHCVIVVDEFIRLISTRRSSCVVFV